jgi:hypothetical protein
MDARAIAWWMLLVALVALPTAYMLMIISARLPH